MIYRKFNPCQELVPFVECYYTWESTTSLTENLIVESPPNGFCSIVFNSGARYFIRNKKYEALYVPPQFIAGQSIYSYELHIKGKISLAGIVFKPAALATLYKLPVYEYTEERIPLQTVFEQSFLQPYIDALANETDPRKKVTILEDFVLKEYRLRQPEPDYIDHAANRIIETNGLLNISELLANIYMSKRSFERNFFKKVGLSPKYYARIRRMSHLANLIAGKKKVDWQELLGQCAYYDQSHFIKDFTSFTGRSPEQYISDNAELANLIPKPNSEELH